MVHFRCDPADKPGHRLPVRGLCPIISKYRLPVRGLCPVISKYRLPCQVLRQFFCADDEPGARPCGYALVYPANSSVVEPVTGS